MESIEITINGETREVPSPSTLRDVVRYLKLTEDRIAIEWNRQIVRRDRWAEIELRNQDRLEIVHFVGGG